jgi:hypothetical protein
LVAQGTVHRQGRICILGQGAYTGQEPLPAHVRYILTEQTGLVLFQRAPCHLEHMTRLRGCLVGRAGMGRAEAVQLAIALVARGVVEEEEALKAAAADEDRSASAAVTAE